ncbi:hypothetical protein NEF87_003545 [Candidatus Lokiarchaeum ossiferum]|uniref:Disease resistance R13L4/SHOC-2-like LRR domain-containing protein n=1 Tax=Candidatus Lokiarchaeum ossiferum TaxID=2951803 RepID=A0ABY6HUS1_9ARCH|nr:hypothetical protein NEF87_003545 [Candidatus Lokiarchaeum sp. B-35]
MKYPRIVWQGNHKYKTLGSHELSMQFPEQEKKALDDIVYQLKENIKIFQESLFTDMQNPYYKHMDIESLEVQKGHLILRITNPFHIEHLILLYRKIQRIPESIENLTHLKHLNISNNDLLYLPESIRKLKNLEVLSVKDNQLSFLPEFIQDLTKLEVLDLSNNKISYFPRFFQQVPKYVFTLFNFKGNPIRSLANISRNHLEQLVKFISINILKLGNWQSFSSFVLTPKATRLIRKCYDLENRVHYRKMDLESLELNLKVFEELYHYYYKDPLHLAEEYSETADLTPDEKIRLIHEADHRVRQILEENCSVKDPILMQVNQRLKISLSDSMNLFL